MKLLEPGKQAPDFNLIDQDGVLINSKSILGKRTLICFYPKAMTTGCTIQACKLRDNMHTFKLLNIEIIGISTDKPEKLLEFSEKEMLNFTLLSDQDHQISKKFGVWGEKKFMGKIYYGIHRVSFLLNKNSVIEQVFTNFTPEDHSIIVLNYLNNKK